MQGQLTRWSRSRLCGCTAVAWCITLSTSSLAQLPEPGLASAKSPLIAIIIDDLGYRTLEDQRALELPGPVTYAVLPGTPNGEWLAERAYASSKEVLLHLPMESIEGKPLGPGGITTRTSEAEIATILDRNLGSVPHISGISSHMGSLLSTRQAQASWLMKAIEDRHEPLFFVDSRTTARSILARTAREHGVPVISRDVFLDHSPDLEHIETQFERLVTQAKANGTALGIGHPYPSTLDFLTTNLANLDLYGVQLVAVSELLRQRFSTRPNPPEVPRLSLSYELSQRPDGSPPSAPHTAGALPSQSRPATGW